MFDRFLRCVGMVALVTIAVLLLIGQGDDKVVTAERFVLVDTAGNERGVLGLDENGNTWFALRDAGGGYRTQVTAADDGTHLHMCSTGGHAAVVLQCKPTLLGMHMIDDGRVVDSITPRYIEYTYLPEHLGMRYRPTEAEWRALEITAGANNLDYLTDRLVRNHLSCAAERDHMVVFVDTAPQPSWDTYRGNGRFSCSDREVRAAYAEAGESVMRHLRGRFPAIADSAVEIRFGIRGATVGTWRDDKMTLAGDN